MQSFSRGNFAAVSYKFTKSSPIIRRSKVHYVVHSENQTLRYNTIHVYRSCTFESQIPYCLTIFQRPVLNKAVKSTASRLSHIARYLKGEIVTISKRRNSTTCSPKYLSVFDSTERIRHHLQQLHDIVMCNGS